MRVRDALAALMWLRAQPEVDPARIVLTGSGMGGLVALHAAIIDASVAGVVGWEGLSSFRSLLGAEHYPWPADAFFPRALQRYDLPDLAAALACPVHLFGLRDGAGMPAGDDELTRYAAGNVVLQKDALQADIVACVRALMA